MLTLLIAESKPEEMKTVKNVVISVLNRSVKKIILKKTYHLISLLKYWGGRTRTSEMAVPKTAALPLGDTPLLGTFLLYILKINCQ